MVRGDTWVVWRVDEVLRVGGEVDIWKDEWVYEGREPDTARTRAR